MPFHKKQTFLKFVAVLEIKSETIFHVNCLLLDDWYAISRLIQEYCAICHDRLSKDKDQSGIHFKAFSNPRYKDFFDTNAFEMNLLELFACSFHIFVIFVMYNLISRTF